MTLPEILALDPEKVRVMVAEAAGIKPWIAEYWCVSPDGNAICFSSEFRHICEEWLSSLSENSEYKRYSVQPFYQYPALTLDNIAQAVAGLTDDEHGRYRSHLDAIADKIAREKYPLTHWAHVDRIREDLSALQRARAFLAAKSE